MVFVIDFIDGKVTEKEKQDMREMLQKITKGKGKPIKDENSESNNASF